MLICNVRIQRQFQHFHRSFRTKFYSIFSQSQMLREMFDLVEQSQRNKLKNDIINLANANLEKRTMRHQISTDNMQAPPFNIPNLRVEQRKTSSAEDMARKNSIGQFFKTIQHFYVHKIIQYSS